MTATELGLPEQFRQSSSPLLGMTREISNVSLFRSALDEWFLSAGGNDFVTLKAKVDATHRGVSPFNRYECATAACTSLLLTGDWLFAGNAALTGQYGMNVNSFHGSTPPTSTRNGGVRGWQESADRQFYVGNDAAGDNFRYSEVLYDANRIPSRGPEVGAALYQGGKPDHYETMSHYVTRNGMDIIYAFRNDDTALGELFQLHHPANNSLRTPHPDQTVINCNDSGRGSLRQAIGYGGIIKFDVQCNRINLTSGPLVIYRYDVGIDAGSVPGGLTISAGGKSGVFEIIAGNSVTLRSMTIADGVALSEGFDRGTGGGILNQGDLRVIGSTIRDDTAAKWGGGLDNQGTALLVNSTIVNNKSNSYAAAGIRSSGALRLVHTTVVGNRGGNNDPGAGIYGFDTPGTREQHRRGQHHALRPTLGSQ